MKQIYSIVFAWLPDVFRTYILILLLLTFLFAIVKLVSKILLRG